MPTTIEQLKPAMILVHRCARRGGLSYRRKNDKTIEDSKSNPEHREKITWESERIIADKEEYDAAVSLRSKCLYAVRKLGRPTAVGILISADRINEIDEELAKWKTETDEFNGKAKHCEVENFIMKFYISGDNTEVLKMMLRDLGELLNDLTVAMSKADPKSIREVIVKLKNFDELLPDVTAKVVGTAIEGARELARNISKAQRELKNAAEDRQEKLVDLELIKRKIDTSPVNLARFAVLTPEDAQEATEDKSGALVGAQMRRRFAALSAPETPAAV
jgi:hypothetical protein